MYQRIIEIKKRELESVHRAITEMDKVVRQIAANAEASASVPEKPSGQAEQMTEGAFQSISSEDDFRDS